MSLKLASVVLAGSISLLVSSVPATAATPKQVDDAIKKAQAYLLSQQNPAGNWETAQKPDPTGGNADVAGKQWGGLTSIVTYALLAAGTSPQAPELAKPVAFLKGANLEGIYATGLRCQVWYLLDDNKLQPFLNRDANTLFNGIHLMNGPQESAGFYPYFFVKPPVDDWYDRSVSQYGVLGVWALAEAGYEVPIKYWILVDGAWRRAQQRDGGWNYNRGAAAASTATMTAAGIATLYITQDYTLGNLAECRGNIVNPNIDAGLAWMDKHIKEALGGNYYGMYGIERIGVASGRKYFETVDWYHDGADFIVKSQQANGSWGGLPDTCFALLFLVRGRAPIVMNKLEYSVVERNGKTAEGPWNERPRDCANFARWMGHNIEQKNLNWQIVNLKVSPEELHDSQILYISGDKDLGFTAGEIAKLRTFAEQGGLILGNADCGRPQFAKSFKELGAKLFPKYEFRELPAGHVIYDEQYPSSKWRPKPKIFGQSNGVRELMILIPDADLSRAWQGRNEKTKADLYQLGANIFLYSVDKKNLQYKGETYIVNEDPAIKTTRSINLGRVELGDNWDPEPAGWPRMTALLHNEQQVALNVKTVPCAAASFKDLKVLHLTGTTSFVLNDDQRKALKDFVDAGGTLIVDAAGGSGLFATAAEAELPKIFGQNADILPLSSPVFNLPGEVIESVVYRNFARKSINGSNKTPRVKAITVKGRLAVFYSREDLSAGIVGEAMDGILGYEPASATALMRNLIMFGAFGFPVPPATRPTTLPATLPTTSPTTVPATRPATAPTTQPAAK